MRTEFCELSLAVLLVRDDLGTSSDLTPCSSALLGFGVPIRAPRKLVPMQLPEPNAGRAWCSRSEVGWWCHCGTFLDCLWNSWKNTEAYSVVLKYRTLHPSCPSQTLHLPLVSWGKLPELNFLICKIRDNDGIYCNGLFEVWSLCKYCKMLRTAPGI